MCRHELSAREVLTQSEKIFLLTYDALPEVKSAIQPDERAARRSPRPSGTCRQHADAGHVASEALVVVELATTHHPHHTPSFTRNLHLVMIAVIATIRTSPTTSGFSLHVGLCRYTASKPRRPTDKVAGCGTVYGVT